MYLPDFSWDSLEMAELIAFHETVHIFNYVSLRGGNSSLKVFTDEIKKRTGRDRYGDNVELQPLVESTYRRHRGFLMGHPEDNLDELTASALTVMHFFPDQLMENLEALPDDKHRFRLTSICLSYLNTLRKFTPAMTKDANLPVQQRLLSYLEEHSLLE